MKLSFNSSRKRGLKPFSRAKKIERFQVARIFLQTRLRQRFAAYPFAKLVDLLAIEFGFAFSSVLCCRETP